MHILEIVFSNQLIALFTVIGAGLLLGNITIKGINLGSSGVLFSALLAGHLGLEIPGGVGNFGLALFVYCVGIGAGPRFFPLWRARAVGWPSSGLSSSQRAHFWRGVWARFSSCQLI